MLRIVNLEEIQGLLLRIPGLIHDLETHAPNLLNAVKDWFTHAEGLLMNNRLAIAGEIAALRGVLICAERGVIPSGVVFTGRATPRKIKEASSAEVLRKAAETISNAIRGQVTQIEEGERLARQLVALARRKGLRTVVPSGGGHSEALREIWRAFSADPDLGAGTTHLAGLVGACDALVLLDRMLLTPA